MLHAAIQTDPFTRRASGPRHHRQDREPHAARRRMLLAAHPEVRKLVGRNPATAGWIVVVGAGQGGLAALAGMGPWWLAPAMAYGVGALFP